MPFDPDRAGPRPSRWEDLDERIRALEKFRAAQEATDEQEEETMQVRWQRVDERMKDLIASAGERDKKLDELVEDLKGMKTRLDRWAGALALLVLLAGIAVALFK